MLSEIPRSRLRVISGALINLGVAFLLSPFATRSLSVLMVSVVGGILCLRIAEYMEETLDNYD